MEKDKKMWLSELTKEKWAIVILLVVISAGLACKFLISLDNDLNSDTVSPGIVSLEIFRHGNVLLNGYFFPSDDPYIFTDILAFHLIPQIVTGFDPLAINIMCFIIFLLITCVYSLIIYKATGSKINALIFTALIATLSPQSFLYYIQPVTHNATILLAGVLILICFDFFKADFLRAFIVPVVAGLTLFSDTAIMAFFIMPLVLFSIVSWKRMVKSIYPVASALLLIGVAAVLYIIKSFDYFLIKVDVRTYDVLSAIDNPASALELLVQKVPHFITDLSALLNTGLYDIIQPVDSSILNGLIVIFFMIFLIVAIRASNQPLNGKSKYVLFMLMVSFVIIFLGYIFTDLDRGSIRYLTFAALIVLLSVSLAYRHRLPFLMLVSIALIFGLIANISYLPILDYQPNKEQYGLIDYLEKNNLTTGYGDYWNANIITYLSDENVTIRAIRPNDNQILPWFWLSCSEWYVDKPSEFFFIEKPGDRYLLSDHLKSLAVKKLAYFDYDIYVYNDSKILGWQPLITS